MSWADDRNEAYEIGDILGIYPSEIDQAHDMGHTWAEVRDQLDMQYKWYLDYMDGVTVDGYEYEDGWPEWASWYHGRGE